MRDLALAGAGAALVVLAVVLVRAIARRGRSRTARRRARVARAGELAAVELLAAAGFTIDDAQATHAWQLTVDGAPHAAALRCDYLVTRDGERWVAEVKTGGEAPRLGNSATRRQLLEYQVAYGAVGVALVDATAGVVHEVCFDLGMALAPAPAGAPTQPWPLLAVGFVAGAATAVASAVALGVSL